MKKDKALYCKITEYNYEDCTFEAGLVKKSPHNENTIYIKIKDMMLHLRIDEAYAIIGCLGEALWHGNIFKINKQGFDFKERTQNEES